MTDPANRLSDLTTPATRGFDAYAQKSDTTDLTYSTRAIYVGSTGDVKVTTIEGDTFTFKNVPAGIVLAVRIKQLWSTGTTVTDCVGLF